LQQGEREGGLEGKGRRLLGPTSVGVLGEQRKLGVTCPLGDLLEGKKRAKGKERGERGAPARIGTKESKTSDKIRGGKMVG